MFLASALKGPNMSAQGDAALRKGNWKFIAAAKGPAINKNVNIETGLLPRPQLYDLSRDLGERNNLASKHPEKVKELQSLLKQIRASGRSRK